MQRGPLGQAPLALGEVQPKVFWDGECRAVEEGFYSALAELLGNQFLGKLSGRELLGCLQSQRNSHRASSGGESQRAHCGCSNHCVVHIHSRVFPCPFSSLCPYSCPFPSPCPHLSNSSPYPKPYLHPYPCPYLCLFLCLSMACAHAQLSRTSSVWLPPENPTLSLHRNQDCSWQGPHQATQSMSGALVRAVISESERNLSNWLITL